MNTKIMASLEQNKIIVIIRHVEKSKLIPLANALYDGGIRFAEITFDQSGKCSDNETADKIKLLCDDLGGKMYFGAGTVMSENQAQTAFNAGAKYIISPDVNIGVIAKTKTLGMLSMPGAITPTEIVSAYNAGADYVKLFPIAELGASYYKAISAPLNHIKMLAVGGIDLNNIADFAGVSGFGVGGSIIRKDLIDKGNFDAITEIAKKYVNCII